MKDSDISNIQIQMHVQNELKTWTLTPEPL
jgi:hypothetical protein